MTLDSQRNAPEIEIKPVPEARRLRIASQLDGFVQNNQHLLNSKDNYKKHALAKAKEVAAFLRRNEEIASISSVTAHGKIETVIIPENETISFMDMADNTFAGFTTIKYEPWELDVPVVYGTCTNDGYEGKGMNSRRIRIAAHYLHAVKNQQLHSARRFDSEASQKTWDTLVDEKRAEWVPQRGQYKYIL